MTPSLAKLAGRGGGVHQPLPAALQVPLLLGWGGVSYSGGTEVRLGQAMRLGATRNAELCYAGRDGSRPRRPARWASTWPARRTST